MKKIRIILIILTVTVVLWSVMIMTDTLKSQSLQEPVFAKEIRAEADNDTIVYQGIGYTVLIRNNADENGEVFPEYSEVKLFGILISAVIV